MLTRYLIVVAILCGLGINMAKEYGKTISTKVPLELDDEFRDLVAKNGHNISRLMSIMVTQYVEMYSLRDDMLDLAEEFKQSLLRGE